MILVSFLKMPKYLQEFEEKLSITTSWVPTHIQGLKVSKYLGYIHVHNTHVYTHTHTETHTHTHTHTHTQRYTCMYTYAHTYSVYICSRVHVCMCTRMCVCSCTRAYVCTFMSVFYVLHIMDNTYMHYAASACPRAVHIKVHPLLERGQWQK